MRPTKLRFEVEMQRSFAARIPIYPPRHAPQVGLLTTAPASTKISISPSFCACRAILLVAGVMISLVCLATRLPFRILAAIRRSPKRPFVQLPMKA